jgi:hypothetical protein
VKTRTATFGYLFVGFIALLLLTGTVHAQNWEQKAGNVATIPNFSSIAYNNNGTYVATSTQAQNSGGNYTFTARIYTSPDLANWTQQDLTPGGAGTDIVITGTGSIGTNSGATGFSINFWNGKFVAWLWFSDSAGGNPTSRIMTSTDGVAWAIQEGNDAFLNVNYQSNQFLATSLSRSYDSGSNTTTLTHKIRTSTDAITWTERYSNTYQSSGHNFSYGGNATFWWDKFFAWLSLWNNSTSPATAVGKLFSSSDGITWNETVTGDGWLGFARLRDTMVVSQHIPASGSTTLKILTSTDDGDTWTEQYNPTVQGTAHISIASNSSDTLVAWTDQTYNNQYTVKMFYSADGITWTEKYNQGFACTGTTSNVSTGYTNPYFTNRIYVNNSGSYTVKIFMSPDGQTWNDTYTTTSSYAIGLAYRNNNFVALGNNGTNAVILRYTGPVTIEYSGTVRDTNNNPVGGATVSLADNQAISTTTSANGRYTLTGITPGSPYTIKIEKNGYRPTYFRPRPYLPPNPHEYSTSMVSSTTHWLYTNEQVTGWGVAANKGFLSCRLTDGLSQYSGGFAGVTFTAASSLHPATPYTVVYSDALGDFGGTSTYPNGRVWVLNVDDGDTVTLNASKAGWNFLPQSYELYGGGATTQNFLGLAAGTIYTISGVARDAATNQPVAGANVSITDIASGVEVARPRTIESGYYMVDLLSAGQYTVRVSRFGYDDSSPPDVVDLSAGSPNKTVNLLMTQLESPTLALSPGWNFISFSKLPLLTDVATMLAQVSPHAKVVWGWNNQTQSWKKWTPDGTGANTLTSVESGKGYWVYMDATGSISTAGWGAPSSTTIHLYDLWNLTGYLGPDHTDPTLALNNVAGRWSIVWGWDNGIWSGKHVSIENLPPPVQALISMNQNKAYWIKVKQGMGTDWVQTVTNYSNATLSGPWILGIGAQSGPYVVGNGTGNITDHAGFDYAGGSYTVQPDGSLSLTMTYISPWPATQIAAYFTSPTRAVVTAMDGSPITGSLLKVSNLSACAGTWTGTVGTANYPISFTVGANGVISSLTFFAGFVSGKMFCESGTAVIFFTANLNEQTDPWNQVRLNGTLSGTTITGVARNDSGTDQGTFTLTKQ